MTTLVAGGAFSGIGGFELGFARAGIETDVMIEWEPSCQTILRKHFPHIRLEGDITHVCASDLGRRLSIWVGGFPCQDTSIAAPHRAGLAGKRSGHFHEFTRLIHEYQRLIDESRPRWVVIENPSGVLTSNGGRDMDTVVRSLEELGYGWAYRTLDGGQFDSTFRRERCIVVGHRGGDPRPAWAVLGDTSPSAQARRARRFGRSPGGPAPAPSPAFDAVWRKSARARAALSKGGYETWVSDGRGNVLTGFDGGLATRQTHLIAQHGRVRTLTLREWERGLGFPDDWTEGITDSARFTAIGNAMHVNVAEWLGTGIVTVNDALPMIGAAA